MSQGVTRLGEKGGLSAAEKAAWLDPSTYGSILVGLLMRQFTSEALTWHPQTILLEVEELLGVPLPPTTYDRLMAAVTLVTTDRFYKDLTSFEVICRTLSGDAAGTDAWEPRALEDAAWGVTEAYHLAPPENDNEPFTQEIRRYIGALLWREGIIHPVDVLRLGTPFLPCDPIDWSDQPDIQAAIAEAEAAKNDELLEIIHNGLAKLRAQAQRLELPSSNQDDDSEPHQEP